MLQLKKTGTTSKNNKKIFVQVAIGYWGKDEDGNKGDYCVCTQWAIRWAGHTLRKAISMSLKEASCSYMHTTRPWFTGHVRIA